LEQLAGFRDSRLAAKVASHIHELAPKYQVKFCHVCGTHEWTVTHFGLRSLLPKSLEIVAGPGCPVCVLPAAEIDAAVEMALEGVTITTFGDLMQVPGSDLTLAQARAKGGDIRVVYGVNEAVNIAKAETNREFIFLAVGFETTAPSTANEVLKGPPNNFSFLVSHRLIPPAMELLLGMGDLHIDGFIAPGHVSTIIGLAPYEVFSKAYHMPVVVAGFEPLDVMFALDMLLQQLKEDVAKLENEYKRGVTWGGNQRALALVERVFNVVDGYWRGLGRLPSSALALKEEFAELDARKKHNVKQKKGRDLAPGCQCHLIMIGKIHPGECQLFMDGCTPESPKGACMVSSEGTCRIWAKHGIQSR
jgi:hydrogenase expression/formation protein HypD